MQNQGLGGFPASAAQSMKLAALALPGLPGLAYQGMEVKKKDSGFAVLTNFISTAVNSVALPPGIAPGDMVIQQGMGVNSVPASWNSIAVPAWSFSQNGVLLWRVLSGADLAARSLAIGTSNNGSIFIFLRGCSQANLMSSFETDSASPGAITLPAWTKANNALAEFVFGYDATVAPASPPAGFTPANLFNGSLVHIACGYELPSKYANGSSITWPGFNGPQYKAVAVEIS